MNDMVMDDQMVMDDMAMDDMNMNDMSMAMTFGKMSQYKVKILFDDWNIKHQWQYVLSWLFVVLFAFLYHVVIKLKHTARRKLLSPLHVVEDQKTPDDQEYGIQGTKLPLVNSCRNKDTKIPIACRIILSLISGVVYAWALTLMLIAMTFNPGLFLAIIAGYTLGDFIFDESSLYDADTRQLSNNCG